MPRIVLFMLMAFVLGIVGFIVAHRGSPSPTAGSGSVTPIILRFSQPKSGGELVQIAGGTFQMGDSIGRPDETPHTVSIMPFLMDRYLVTQELYEHIVGANPSKRKGKTLPVQPVDWHEAVRFCNKCSEIDGLIPCYNLKTGECNFDADGYRLPTEAEWEYACRAGGNTKYFFGDNDSDMAQFGWCKPHSAGSAHPVGQKLPNAWGLYDMHGNAWQWCTDFYADDYYRSSPHEDPKGPSSGKTKVLRGGAWDSTPEKCRSAYRFQEFPTYADACFGADNYSFRRVRREKTGAGTTSVATPAQTREETNPATGAAPKVSVPTPASGSIDLRQLKGTIVFVSDRDGTLHIWRMQASGKDLRQLTHSANPDADPHFSPDGKRIAYTTLREGFPEVWQMNRDGSDQKFITKGSQASWSPDGNSLLFIRDNQTFLRELASGKEQRVTPENWERCGVPAWSPDGRHFAVASRHLGDVGIFILSVDGKENAQLKTQEACCTPVWSQDGKRILCQTVNGHIHQVDINGKNWDQLTFGGDVQHEPCYSPDGTMLLFCRSPDSNGPWQICVKKLSSDDEDFTPITTENSNLLPDWHASEE